MVQYSYDQSKNSFVQTTMCFVIICIQVIGALLLLSISMTTVKETLSTSAATYTVTPDSYLTAVSQTVTGVTGDLQCSGICLTAEPYTCLSYSYCHTNRACLLSGYLPASANGQKNLSDSNCIVYQNSGLFFFPFF